ncbi:MAG: hypothetical protein IJK67_04475 [Bacilli bacterium]|nr:hypothetical protein [Bacilli bacterium]
MTNELLRYFILAGYRDGEYILLEEYEELQEIIKKNSIARQIEEIRYKWLTGEISDEEYTKIYFDLMNQDREKELKLIQSKKEKPNESKE